MLGERGGAPDDTKLGCRLGWVLGWGVPLEDWDSGGVGSWAERSCPG